MKLKIIKGSNYDHCIKQGYEYLIDKYREEVIKNDRHLYKGVDGRTAKRV